MAQDGITEVGSFTIQPGWDAARGTVFITAPRSQNLTPAEARALAEALTSVADEADETALDVWFRFDAEDDEEASHEANTFRDGDGFRVEWSHTDVGQVTEVRFATRKDATAWLEANGYRDFTP